LLLTYALVLIIDDVAKIVFGAEYKSVVKPEFLSGSVTLFGATIPIYTLLVLIIAPLLALCSGTCSTAPRWGKSCGATSSDREMADALGINMTALFTLVFAFGAMLAGFGGALAAPGRTVFPAWARKSSSNPLWWWSSAGWEAFGARWSLALIGALELSGLWFSRNSDGPDLSPHGDLLAVRPWDCTAAGQDQNPGRKNLSMEPRNLSRAFFHPHACSISALRGPVLPAAGGRPLLPVPDESDPGGRAHGHRFNLLLGTTACFLRARRLFGWAPTRWALLLTKTAWGIAGSGLASCFCGDRRVDRFFCVRLSGVQFPPC